MCPCNPRSFRRATKSRSSSISASKARCVSALVTMLRATATAVLAPSSALMPPIVRPRPPARRRPPPTRRRRWPPAPPRSSRSPGPRPRFLQRPLATGAIASWRRRSWLFGQWGHRTSSQHKPVARPRHRAFQCRGHAAANFGPAPSSGSATQHPSQSEQTCDLCRLRCKPPTFRRRARHHCSSLQRLVRLRGTLLLVHGPPQAPPGTLVMAP